MRNKAVKGYWSKKKEVFKERSVAKRRAAAIRNNEYSAHVQVIPTKNGFAVCYSIPKWYEAELENAGIKL